MSFPNRYYLTENGPVMGTPPEELGQGGESQSFELLDVKWGDSTNGTTGGTVTWSFATANLGIEPSDFTLPMPTFFQDEVRAAFDAWEAVADIDFVEVTDGTDVNIRVGMGELDGPLTGSGGGTVGTAFYSFSGGSFNQAHVVLDVEDYFNESHQSEFFLTTLHEIGHAIGLDHEDDVPSIMSTFVDDSLTGLTQDDINGVQEIYGSSSATIDDFDPESPNTNGTVALGGTTDGDIEVTSDADWFAVTLVEGNEYRFDLEAGTLDDPQLELRDSSGTLITSDNDSGTGRDSQITYTATASGTFYLVASETGNGTGTYTVRATDLGVPSNTIPGITVTESGDAAASTATSASIISGDTYNGTLSSTSDRDWISIELTAGTEYTFDLQGMGAGAGTLADGFLVLRDASGGFVAQDDNGSLTSLDARLVFTPDSSGTYYISARTFGTDGGTYSLVTSPEERTEDDGSGGGDGGGSGGDGGGTIIPGITVSEGSTDAPASSATTASIISGDTFEGELDVGTDRDWVGIELTAGTSYTFNLGGVDSGVGTLDDPFLVLRDANGGFVDQDDDSGPGLESEISFTPTSSGTYYLEVRNFSGETGTYSLTTSPEERTGTDGGGDGGGDGGSGNPNISEGTDAAGDTTTSAQMSVGDTFDGELDTVGDRDFVAIDLTAGTTYTFDLQGADSNEGSLADPFLILRDANGTFVDQDDNSGTGLDSQITFTPSSTGTYFLSVRNFTGETGTYALTASSGSAAQAGQQAANEGPGEGYASSVDYGVVQLEADQMRMDLF